MSFEETNKRLNKHIFGIKSLISNPELRDLITESGIMGEMIIRTRTQKGEYIGGTHKNRGYSRTPLPIFFFGEEQYVKRTKNIRLNAPKHNINNVLIKRADTFWTTQTGGKKTAWLKEGYSTFLKYTRPGKNLSKVDHIFTGQMMNAFTHDFTIKTGSAHVRFYVRSPHDDKAYYTNLIREWLGFNEREIEQLSEMAQNKYGIILEKKLSTE